MPIIFIIAVAVFLKQIFWILAIPMWQAPDEQAHFAQLQYMVENRTLTIADLNLSQEIAASEDLLGTRRDSMGNNKYTYHPEYKNHTPIPDMPVSTRMIYVDQEAAGYPPLYYILAAPFYYLTYFQNLTMRLLASRSLSLICYLLLVFSAYKIGRIIWPEKLRPAALAVLVAFQPMISFVAAGFHPDNLLNLIYTLFLLFCLLILKEGLKLKYLFSLIILAAAGIETKPLMYYAFPLAGAVVLVSRMKARFSVPLSVLVLASPLVYFFGRISVPFLPQIEGGNKIGLTDYLKFRIPKMFFEVWPWYWGVFRWLSLALPPLVMKAVTRIAAIAIFGLMVKICLWIRRRRFSFEDKALIFFAISTVSYIVYLLVLDWRFMQSTGFSLGIQGRYLLPNIVPEMTLFLVGWMTLFGRFKKAGAGLIITGMVALNIVALVTVAGSY